MSLLFHCRYRTCVPHLGGGHRSWRSFQWWTCHLAWWMPLFLILCSCCVVRANKNATLYGCDCSSAALRRATELVVEQAEGGAERQTERFHPFLCDVSSETLPSWLCCASCRVLPTYTCPKIVPMVVQILSEFDWWEVKSFEEWHFTCCIFTCCIVGRRSERRGASVGT